jgi:hypothetical protein
LFKVAEENFEKALYSLQGNAPFEYFDSARGVRKGNEVVGVNVKSLWSP